MSKKVKIFAIVVLSIALLVWVLSLAGGTDTPTESVSPLSTTVGTPMTSTPDATAGGSDFATLLSSIKSITIDDSIFSNPAYKALRDHPITLGSDTIGRANPFAPVGTDIQGSTGAAVTIQTLQPGKVTSTSAEFAAQLLVNTTASVSVVFQYGPTDAFGSATAPTVITKTGTALQTVKDLLPDTMYYVQAVAVVGSTTTNGNTMTFTTTTAPKAKP